MHLASCLTVTRLGDLEAVGQYLHTDSAFGLSFDNRSEIEMRPRATSPCDGEDFTVRAQDGPDPAQVAIFGESPLWTSIPPRGPKLS